MAESAAALLVSVWLLLGLRWRSSPTVGRSLAWGAAGGLAALARSELALLAVAGVLLVALALRHWPAVIAVAAASVIVVAPWVAWNATRFDRVVLLSTNDGTTLRGANCDETYTGSAIGSWVLDCLVHDGGRTVRLETSVRAARWRGEGLDYARAHAGRLPVVLTARVGRMLDVYGLSWMVAEDVRDDRPRWGSWLGIGSWWVLAPFATVGLARVRRPFERALVVAPVVVVVLTTIAFYGGHRIRSPMEPVVAVGAALSLRRRDADGSTTMVE
jgi:hypothetical protein